MSHTRYGLDGYRLWHTATEGAGRRVVRDGGATVGVFSASGALVEWVLPGGLGRLEGPTLALRYALRDHLGTARVTVDASRAVTEARDYYAFGLEMPGRVYVQGVPSREGFTGHVLDAETGMNYAWARYYSAALGRFTSTDPHAASYPGWSPYHYAANNPVSIIDPTGKDWERPRDEKEAMRIRSDTEASRQDYQERLAQLREEYRNSERGSERRGELAQQIGNAADAIAALDYVIAAIDELGASQTKYRFERAAEGENGSFGYVNGVGVLTVGSSLGNKTHEVVHAYRNDSGDYVNRGYNDDFYQEEVIAYQFQFVNDPSSMLFNRGFSTPVRSPRDVTTAWVRSLTRLSPTGFGTCKVYAPKISGGC